MVSEVSLANLRPGVYPPPNNTGKKYQHSSAYILERLLAEEDSGGSGTRFIAMLNSLVKDALTQDNEPIDRHRAVNIILDRLEGKALQRGEMKVDVDLNVSGKRAVELTKEQRAYIAAHLDEFDLLADGTIAPKTQEAEFTDLDADTQHPESGDSEP